MREGHVDQPPFQSTICRADVRAGRRSEKSGQGEGEGAPAQASYRCTGGAPLCWRHHASLPAEWHRPDLPVTRSRRVCDCSTGRLLYVVEEALNPTVVALGQIVTHEDALPEGSEKAGSTLPTSAPPSPPPLADWVLVDGLDEE